MLSLTPSRLKFRQINFSALFTVVFVAVLLTGCGVTSTPPNTPADGNYDPNAGRYSLENDVPDLENFDPGQVREIVPRVEQRTRAGNTSPYTINGRTYYVMNSEEGYEASGRASWYGRKFHGHLTANGEIYDMFQLTAAHKTLPIPSYVRVTNLENGRQVVVRVNDRGPFHEDRIIDLSYAAATMLDYADKGTARVRVEAIVPGSEGTGQLLANTAPPAPVSGNPVAGDSPEYLQVGAFSSYDVAQSLIPRLARITSLPVFIRSEAGSGSGNVLHRVRIGPLTEGLDLDDLVRNIVEADLGNPFRVRQ